MEINNTQLSTPLTPPDLSTLPEIPPPTPVNHKRIFKIAIAIILIIIVLGVLSIYFKLSNKTSDVPPNSQGKVSVSPSAQPSNTATLLNASVSPTPQPSDLPPMPELKGDYSVVVKADINDNLISNIFLKSKQTQEEIFFISIPEVYRGHYHKTEFHNGNLYIITRTGGDSGYYKNPDWTDMLWRYDQKRQGQKLYSVKGLDFRVSDDEKYIAIITNEEFNLLDNNGSVIKTVTRQEANTSSNQSPEIGFSSFGKEVIWLNNGSGPYTSGLVKIDLTSNEITKYDLSDLSNGPESSFNPDSELIALSNYPAFFDVESAKEYEQSGSKVNLIVYDLKTKSRQQIATSIVKRFRPTWVNENTLEYDNPDGDGRLTKEF